MRILMSMILSMANIFPFKFGWINFFGAVIVMLLVIPYVFFEIKFRNRKRRRMPGFVMISEKFLWSICCILMIVNFERPELGFDSKALFVIYLIGNIVLLTVYCATWISFFIKPAFGKRVTVAVVAVLVFCLSGVTLADIFLIVFASLFGTCHIFLASQDEYE